VKLYKRLELKVCSSFTQSTASSSVAICQLWWNSQCSLATCLPDCHHLQTIYQLNRRSFCASSKVNDHVWMSTNKRLASIGGMHSISPPRIALIQSMYKHTHQPKGILISKQRNIHGFSWAQTREPASIGGIPSVPRMPLSHPLITCTPISSQFVLIRSSNQSLVLQNLEAYNLLLQSESFGYCFPSE